MLKVLKALVLMALMAMGLAAQAEVPAGVLTAITGATTDIATIGAAILIVVVSIAGFVWLRKPIH